MSDRFRAAISGSSVTEFGRDESVEGGLRPPAALPNVILTAGVLPLSALRVRGDRGSCFRLDVRELVLQRLRDEFEVCLFDHRERRAGLRADGQGINRV